MKFTELEKTLGKAKTASIVNNDESTISALTNAQFFANTDKYGSIPVAADELLVYQVDKSQQASQQKLANVKDKVSKALLHKNPNN